MCTSEDRKCTREESANTVGVAKLEKKDIALYRIARWMVSTYALSVVPDDLLTVSSSGSDAVLKTADYLTSYLAM